MEILVVGAAIVHRRRCLVVQRSAEMTTPLKWEFPGGKVETDEDPKEALRREIREELGIEIEVQGHLARGFDHQPKRSIILDVFLASPGKGEVELREHRRLAWCRGEDLDSLDWAEADLPAVDRLKSVLRNL
ncbi:MAG: (deoxy)nucleoside triphosphate pyrophosphohydrolase [Deltaproteobacteria bacterium]|nr:(deoxy)nucleoside triphosphate pyrophosphohydrolase [Deltaproteobacteria bacterium]